ncbi:MAG TPA: ATP-binding protein [Ktedonobacteraceae bacterium]|nr:ATP-binding protein [Ktedonobacteraceae bacterium]
MVSFPFSAIVGQQQMRLALLLNAIDPSICGVLLCGKRGTGKSTLARALTTLFPLITGVADCPYCCDPDAPQWMCETCLLRIEHGEQLPLATRPVPFVTLPLNASEDRIAGSFDIASALESGTRRFSPGLLATANRGVLYVDELNLLNDHSVDLLLDAAATGIHHVERDAISITHPARFVLIGTMNPEEGQLRPQLLDRIGLFVEAEDFRDPTMRTLIVERRLAYDANPAHFAAQWADSEQTLREHVQHAREQLTSIHVSPYVRQVIAYLVDRQLHTTGHRADIVVTRTARAIAAWEGHDEITRADIEQAIALAMPHRSNNARLTQRITQMLEQLPGGAYDTDRPQELATIDTDIDERTDEREGAAGVTRTLHGEQDVAQVQELIHIIRDRQWRSESGRHFISLTTRRSGRSTRTRSTHPVTDIAFPATIAAAAPYQRSRGRVHGGKVRLQVEDLRQKVRERKTRSLLIFVIDGSDSVMARQLMVRMKRILLALLQHAYEKRDRVAMLVFRFAQGRIVLPPTRNFMHARKVIDELYVGGCTPLATGLLEGLRLAETERMRDPTVRPLLIILTDGLANIDLSGNMRSVTPQRDALHVAQEIATRRIPTVLIDTNPYAPTPASTQPPLEDKPLESSLAPGYDLALALDADYYRLSPPHSAMLLQRG